MNDAPGKGLLKVTGILLIVFAGLGLFGLIGLVAALQYLGLAGPMIFMVFAVSVVMTLLQLAAGILGVKNCDKPEKAQTCFVMGVVLILIVIISAIVSIAGSNFALWSTIISLVLPVLYVLGALKNKEASGAGVQGSIIDQAKDALGNVQADIQSGAIADQAKAAVSDIVDKDKETVDKATDMVDGDDNK